MAEDDLHRAVRDAVGERLRQAIVPGAGVAIVIDGEVAFAGGVGSRDLAGDEPLSEDVRFYVYSITKTIWRGSRSNWWSEAGLGWIAQCRRT